MKEGITYIYRTKEILGALCLDMFAVLFGGAVAMIPVFASDILGIAWFIFLTGTGVWSAFLLCMFPFLPGDLAKILLASFLVSKYRGRLIQG
jgi:biotin transporter BioY